MHVCDLINATVNMGYGTFGAICLQWFILTVLAIYILLYLDQEVLSELTNDMGGRAYRARTAALAAAGKASRPDTEYGRGAYSEKAGTGYASPTMGGAHSRMAMTGPPASSRGYSEAEGGRPHAYSEGSRSESVSDRTDDLENRETTGEDEAYYGALARPLVLFQARDSDGDPSRLRR